MKLTKEQKESLKEIVNTGITNDFYLAEGTALSIKHSHRNSEDFDFFTNEYKKDFMKILSVITPDKVLTLDSETLIFIYQYVKFSFFKYKYKLLKSPVFHKGLKIFLASDCDIAAMKSIAIIQRGEKKDFFDLWYLMKKKNWKIADIINFSSEKYGNIFNPSVFIKAIVYFKDAERQDIKEIDSFWFEIKKFFRDSALSYMKSL